MAYRKTCLPTGRPKRCCGDCSAKRKRRTLWLSSSFCTRVNGMRLRGLSATGASPPPTMHSAAATGVAGAATAEASDAAASAAAAIGCVGAATVAAAAAAAAATSSAVPRSPM